jgi:hypothetical protein
MLKILSLTLAVMLLVSNQATQAQTGSASELLAHALHLADLYNWADAASSFSEAEELFKRAGDRRNALYAHLGRIRANVDRDQRALPEVSVQLANALREDTLLQSDK